VNRRLVVLIAVLLAVGIPAGPVRAEPGDQLPTIRGLVWDDRNRNGLQDEGEPGVKGVGVLVRGPSFPEGDAGAVRRAKALAMLRTLRPGQVAAFDPDIDVTQTDENGRYVFEQRRAGRNLLEV